nr:hypothetical protein [Kribbella speibonae]
MTTSTRSRHPSAAAASEASSVKSSISGRAVVVTSASGTGPRSVSSTKSGAQRPTSGCGSCPVCPDHIAAADLVAPVGSGDRGDYPVGVLCQSGQLVSAAYLDAELGSPFSQHPLDLGLRYGQ